MDLYALAEGPLVWISFAVFLIGTLVRWIALVAESRQRDKIFYQHFQWKWVFATFFKWLLPINKDMGKNPVFSLAAYVFHICLIVVPIWYLPHVIAFETSSLGWSWWAMPDSVADWMTLAMLVCGAILIVRRIVDPSVKALTTPIDFVLLVVTMLPFLTGYLSAHATLGATSFLGSNMQLIHMLSGELMLILIPFTKLSHFVLFFFVRATAGVEFGRRGYSI